MTAPRLLRVRCTRWDQVEAFLRKKLRPDGRLSMKVPFDAAPGAPVTLAIELPSQIVVALDGEVGAPADDDRRDAAVVVLTGAAAAIERLEAMLADAQAGGAAGEVAVTLAAREAELRKLRQQAAHEVLGCSRSPTLEELRAAWRQRARREHPDGLARYGSTALRLTAEEGMIHVTRAYQRLRATVCADRRAVIAGTGVRTVGSLAIEAAPADSFDVVALTPPVVDLVEVTAAPRRDAPAAPALGPPALELEELGEVSRSLALDLDLPPPPPARGSSWPPPVRHPTAPPTLAVDAAPPPARPVTKPPPARRARPDDTTIEQSLRQARSGPGDRFVRAIRDRLASLDHAGASQLAQAASQVYPKDRRLAALVEIAAAQGACVTGDRAAAVAATRAALAHDPDAAEARRILAQLEQGGVVAPDLIGGAYR
ncbi:MAG: hypothetical protein R3B06_27255 [Kofleriaceae bacterium]